MNTGMGDAVDVRWKLVAALGGWAGEKLLQRYDVERRPIGWRNVNAEAANFSTMAPRLDFAAVEDDGARGHGVRPSSISSPPR